MIERGDQNEANANDPITTISKEDLNTGVPKILNTSPYYKSNLGRKSKINLNYSYANYQFRILQSERTQYL